MESAIIENKQTIDDFRLEVRNFVNQYVLTSVQEIDLKQKIDPALFYMLGQKGYLASNIPKQFGGLDLNNEQMGLFHEEFGKSHASIENILTVIGMAVSAILRGNKELKQTWLPRIAKGEIIPAFALTEPNIGSDIQNIETTFQPIQEGYLIKGVKKWITLGSYADIFIVFAKQDDRGAAFIVPKETLGLAIHPIKDMLGFRGNMLATVHMDNCFVPASNMIGSIGSGLKITASWALNEGRYMTAWGAVGLAQAALDKAIEYTSIRKQFNQYLNCLDGVKQMIAKMVVSIEASRALCKQAGLLREQGSPDAIKMTIVAKYHASKTASQVSEQAIQLLGAYGCHQDGQVERYFRDSKIMELIEGSSEVLEIQIGELFRN